MGITLISHLNWIKHIDKIACELYRKSQAAKCDECLSWEHNILYDTTVRVTYLGDLFPVHYLTFAQHVCFTFDKVQIVIG